MVDKQKKIWLDGEFIDWDDAKVHVLTHSLHYGLAAFDGIRAYQRSDGGTYVFRLRDHIERLFDTCKMCLLQPKFTREQVEQVCLETLRVNGMVDGYLRPMVFVGEGAMGIYAPQNPVRTAVIAWRWGAYLGEEALKNGIRAKISSFARHHINVSLSKAKMNGQYTNSVLAKREAKLGGYDEAILLDANGYVSEGSGENIFIVRRGVLYTPDLSCSILEGITRDTVITLAREMDVPVVECRLTRDQLWLADEVFFTGTAAEVTPVREVDNRTIGEGTVGPITAADPGALLRCRARQRHVAPRVADARVGRPVASPRASRALVATLILAGCASPGRPSATAVQPASPAAVSFTDDGKALPRYHSRRLALSLPLPDGGAWRIDDHSRPELVATHAPTRSRLVVAVFRAGRARRPRAVRRARPVASGLVHEDELTSELHPSRTK